MTRTTEPSSRTQVVIIGGGFGGLHVAKGLRKSNVDVTLIDRRNFHLFQPLLYQVATGALSPANIAAPLRHVLSQQKNCQVLLGEVEAIDPQSKRVHFTGGEIPYDILVIAAGATHSYFGHDEWEPMAPGLKTLEDATEIRARLLTAFESAELEQDPHKRRAWLNFVIVGGGPTGVELAGAIAEIARHSLKYDFRSIDPSDAQILLVEAGDRVLTAFPPELSQKAEQSLKKLGVTVRNKWMVTQVTEDHVVLKSGEVEETIPTRTVLWAAGVRASRLAKKLAATTGVELDRAGRVIVEPDLSIPGYPEIFVIGDMANYSHQGGKPLPGVAPVAIQEGKFVAKLIDSRIRNRPAPKFHYRDPGSLATIGRSAAVADFGWVKFAGFMAWMLWLVVHLMNIVSFRNRLLVLFQWGWSYLSHDRAARLITGTMRPELKSGSLESSLRAAPSGEKETAER